MSEAVQWRLKEMKADLACGPLRGRILLNHLVAGLGEKTWNGHKCEEFAVLQIAAPLTESAGTPDPVETYVRGRDLVAVYPRTPPLTVAPQIYWRAAFDEAISAASIEVVLSMHTDLLDSRPQSAINSIGFGCELYHASEIRPAAFERLSEFSSPEFFDARTSPTQLFLLRHTRLGVSYAEMVHPTDFDAVQIDYRGERYNSYRIHSTLFLERLEKGVIRRGRICGWFLPAENDLEVAVELAKRFIDEPLPLTA